MIDPQSVLGPAELAAARANVEAALPLSSAQLDLISDLFRPVVQRLLAEPHSTVIYR